MTENLYGIYGASGFGREVMPLARETIKDGKLVFIDDGVSERLINGHEVMTYSKFLNYPATSRSVCLAIANHEIRLELDQRCGKDGVTIFDVYSDSSVFLDDIVLGSGAIVCPFTTMTSNIQVGRHFHANIYSYVAHDCVIGNYVTFAPSVKCNGNVVIEDGAYIGTGAILKQGKPGKPLVIGAGAVVGMGAVVTKNVLPGQVVIGNPAKPLSKSSVKSP